MRNTFTGDIAKPIADKKGQELKIKIDQLSGQNWKKEIRELSSEFSLNAEKIIGDVKKILVEAFDGETLKKELEENKERYQKYYEKLNNKDFDEAKQVVESLLEYIEKIRASIKERITNVLLSNPGVEERMPIFMKNMLGEDIKEKKEGKKTSVSLKKENKEEKKSQVKNKQEAINTIDQDEKLMDEITSILAEKIDEEDKVAKIKIAYKKIFGKNLVLKIFYSKLGLTDKKQIQERMSIESNLVELLILTKKNPNDTHTKADLERYLNGGDQKQGEIDNKSHVTVVGHIDLSGVNTERFVKKQKEVMQATTTDPLDKVGEKMSLDSFLQASRLSYKELRLNELHQEAVPGRYRGYNPNPLRNGKIAHYFTVGSEDKFDKIPVNAYVEVEPSVKFEDDMVYKIKITGIKPSSKSDDRKQSQSVRGEIYVDPPELVRKGHTIGEVAKLLKKAKK